MILSTVLGKMGWKRQMSDQQLPGKWNVSQRMELSESKNGVIFDILFHLLAEMIQDLKMWCEVENPCYQGSGSRAPGITLVNFVGADERSTAGHVVVLVRM